MLLHSINSDDREASRETLEWKIEARGVVQAGTGANMAKKKKKKQG